MMGAIGRDVRLDLAGRDGVREQIVRAATHVAAHLIFAQRRQAVQRADVVTLAVMAG